jgi:DNA-binding protein H-NS
MSNTITDKRAVFWGNVLKYSMLLVVGFFVAPFIWIAIGGLLGLFVAAVILLAGWMFRPVAFSMAANARLYFIKAEARRNPCETLEDDLRKQMVELDKRREATNRLKAQVMNLTDKLDDYKAKWGASGADYQKLLAARDNLKRLHEHRLNKWDDAHVELGKWSREIERAKDLWAAACAAADAQEESGLSEDDFFQKLKTETALDSIKTSFNTQLASLDTELAAADNEPIMGR